MICSKKLKKSFLKYGSALITKPFALAIMVIIPHFY